MRRWYLLFGDFFFFHCCCLFIFFFFFFFKYFPIVHISFFNIRKFKNILRIWCSCCEKKIIYSCFICMSFWWSKCCKKDNLLLSSSSLWYYCAHILRCIYICKTRKNFQFYTFLAIVVCFFFFFNTHYKKKKIKIK